LFDFQYQPFCRVPLHRNWHRMSTLGSNLSDGLSLKAPPGYPHDYSVNSSQTASSKLGYNYANANEDGDGLTRSCVCVCGRHTSWLVTPVSLITTNSKTKTQQANAYCIII
jgi:hypothetical protein